MATQIMVTRIWQQGYSRCIRLGEYEIDDKRLLGKGQYLVDNGFAHIVESEKIKEVEPPKTAQQVKEVKIKADKPKTTKGGKR